MPSCTLVSALPCVIAFPDWLIQSNRTSIVGSQEQWAMTGCLGYSAAIIAPDIQEQKDRSFVRFFFPPLKLFKAFLSFSWRREAHVLSWEWITGHYSKAKVCFGFKKVNCICRSQCLMVLCLLKCIKPTIIHADPQAFFVWLSLRKSCMPSTYSDRFL